MRDRVDDEFYRLYHVCVDTSEWLLKKEIFEKIPFQTNISLETEAEDVLWQVSLVNSGVIIGNVCFIPGCYY